MNSSDKIIAIVVYHDTIVCLTEYGELYALDPYTGVYTLFSKGI